MAEDTALKSFIHDKYEQLFSDWSAAFPFPSYVEGLYSDDWDLLMFVGKKNSKKMLFMLSLIPTGIQSLVVLTVMGSKAFPTICVGLP